MYIVISILIVVIDQICKFYAYRYIKGSSGFELIKGLLNIVYVENRGIAFGIFSGASRYIFIILSLAMVVTITYLLLRNKRANKIFKISSAFIIGGGIGNLIDRVLWGYVIDYLQLSFFSPICNISDYFITFGAVLMIVYLIFIYDKEKDVKDKIWKHF